MFLYKQMTSKKQKFQKEFSQKQRIQKCEILKQRYPKSGYSFIIIEGLSNFQNQQKDYIMIGIEDIITIAMLLDYSRRKIIKGQKQLSLTVVVKRQIRQASENIGELYSKYKDQDGFLYVQLKAPNFF